MKNFIKFLLICGLAIGLGRYVFTQTPRGQDYARKNFSRDVSLIKSELLEALDGTGVIVTWDAVEMSGDIVWSDTGSIVVDQSVLDQRLDYYKKAKDKLWQE